MASYAAASPNDQQPLFGSNGNNASSTSTSAAAIVQPSQQQQQRGAVLSGMAEGAPMMVAQSNLNNQAHTSNNSAVEGGGVFAGIASISAYHHHSRQSAAAAVSARSGSANSNGSGHSSGNGSRGSTPPPPSAPPHVTASAIVNSTAAAVGTPPVVASGGVHLVHQRTESMVGAQNMCNLFINNPNASVGAAGGLGSKAARSNSVQFQQNENQNGHSTTSIATRHGVSNTLMSNSVGYISRAERVGAEEYIAALENIHKTYLLGVEGVPALRGVNVEIKRGEFMVVFGTSGGGKSTLLNILGTIDVPTKGNLMLLDSRITDRTPDADLARMRCRHVGFVFQSFNLLSTMTAVENVSLPMIIAGDLSRAEIKARAEMLLTMVGLAHRMDHFPSMLSGGEQQRVTIARSLANEPDMLLMDEPTGDLDTKNTHLILSILLNLNREKQITMVMVTHDVYMKPYADRILYLRDGRVANIENVPRSVNERAYERLLELVEDDKMHVGEHVEQTGADGKVALSVVRNAVDYDTKEALRPVDHSAMDSEMRAAVAMLFGSRNGKAADSRNASISQQQQQSSSGGGYFRRKANEVSA